MSDKKILSLNLYKEETGKEPLVAVVGHGERLFASWDYQLWLEKKLGSIKSDIINRLEKLYVKKIESDSLSPEEQELSKAVHNDAVSLCIDQIENNLIVELS